MALDYTALGKRISTFRSASGLTQEQFCEKLNVSRKHISQIEAAISRPSLETLVDIANVLNISADDLLVDSLTHSASTADSEIHRLLLDCNAIEQEILTRMVKEMKAILYGLRRFTKGYYIKQLKMDCQPTEFTALSRHRAVFSWAGKGGIPICGA